MFQDDIMRAAGSVEAARAGNIKMASVIDSKQLTFNPDKTGFIMFGKEKVVKGAREDIARSPLLCGNFVRVHYCYRFVGDGNIAHFVVQCGYMGEHQQGNRRSIGKPATILCEVSPSGTTGDT
jgi:hypothetical protein